ncbi:HAD family hydrolase [Candidatus Pacearchaeota archaeon]|nr:HAD family hydrolase [Candidatus Pacearchaeota archaeon]
MLELFIFDHSGVLSDDRRPVYEANMMLLKDYGKDRITMDEWINLSSSSPQGFLRNFGIEIKVEDEGEVFERYTKYFNVLKESEPPFMYKDVDKVLRELDKRGKDLAVISSHPLRNLKNELSEYGVINLFLDINGSVRNKSNVLINMCRDIGIDKNNVVYTGDTIYDIQSARTAGVNSVGVCGGYHPRSRLEAECPTHGVLDDLSGLLGI